MAIAEGGRSSLDSGDSYWNVDVYDLLMCVKRLSRESACCLCRLDLSIYSHGVALINVPMLIAEPRREDMA